MTNWINPIAAKWDGHPIYWYGVWVAAGFLAAVLNWSWLARREGRRGGFGADFGLLVMLSGIIGSRLAYVLAHAAEYATRPADILRIDRGGLVFYGGFILATLAVWIFARARRESPLHHFDYAVTGLALGHAFGRAGCFFNGCCYGAESSAPWACLTAGATRQPVQLFEAVFNIGLWIALARRYRRGAAPGSVFGLYMLAYGSWRFVIEFWRGDERQVWLGLHAAQWISVGLILSGALLLLSARKKHAA